MNQQTTTPRTRKPRLPRLCESCQDAFEDEGHDGPVTYDVLFLGSEIADHCCSAVEEGGTCDCPCTTGY